MKLMTLIIIVVRVLIRQNSSENDSINDRNTVEGDSISDSNSRKIYSNNITDDNNNHS